MGAMGKPTGIDRVGHSLSDHVVQLVKPLEAIGIVQGGIDVVHQTDDVMDRVRLVCLDMTCQGQVGGGITGAEPFVERVEHVGQASLQVARAPLFSMKRFGA